MNSVLNISPISARNYGEGQNCSKSVRQPVGFKYLFKVLQRDMSTGSPRATYWSITINNPEEREYVNVPMPPGWVLEGQVERGEQGTEHFQGCLKTTQVRMSSVKRHFPRAHIEIARDVKALKAYVHKDETRVAEVKTTQAHNVFTLQELVFAHWDDDRFKLYMEHIMLNRMDMDEAYLKFADILVQELIENGATGGIEYVCVCPAWRHSMKKFGRAMVKRFRAAQQIKMLLMDIEDGAHG